MKTHENKIERVRYNDHITFYLTRSARAYRGELAFVRRAAQSAFRQPVADPFSADHNLYLCGNRNAQQHEALLNIFT